MYALNELRDNKNKVSEEEERSLSDDSSVFDCNGSDSFRNNLKHLLHSYRFHVSLQFLRQYLYFFDLVYCKNSLFFLYSENFFTS